MSKAISYSKKQLEKTLKKYAKRKEVSLALGCSGTYVSKLVQKFDLKHRAKWLTKGDINV